MKVQIELDSMNFYAFHGVAPQERTVGNTFIVDLLLTADVAKLNPPFGGDVRSAAVILEE